MERTTPASGNPILVDFGRVTVYLGVGNPALAPGNFVVAQGSFYWHLELRQLQRRRPLPPWFPAFFRGLYWTTVVGAILFPVWLVVRLLQGVEMNVGDALWGGGLYVFAVLELVNYYHWQLTHDTRRDLLYLWHIGDCDVQSSPWICGVRERRCRGAGARGVGGECEMGRIVPWMTR